MECHFINAYYDVLISLFGFFSCQKEFDIIPGKKNHLNENSSEQGHKGSLSYTIIQVKKDLQLYDHKLNESTG